MNRVTKKNITQKLLAFIVAGAMIANTLLVFASATDDTAQTAKTIATDNSNQVAEVSQKTVETFTDNLQLSSVSATSDDVIIEMPSENPPQSARYIVDDIPFIGGDGTAENPYQITSKWQLHSFSDYTIWDDMDAHYILMADIVFEEADFADGAPYHYFDEDPNSGEYLGLGFEPIGHGGKKFMGSFDGNGYTISGLFSSYDGNSWMYIGLFGWVENATIKNVTLTDVDITAVSNTEIDTGGVVGFARNSAITNCTVSGSITGDEYTGGIVGRVDLNTTVDNCTNNATVTAIDRRGYYDGGYYFNYEYVDDIYAGGIVGHLDYIESHELNNTGIEESGSTVSNCVNNGIITAEVGGGQQNGINSSSNAGGIVGLQRKGFILNCTNNAKILATVVFGSVAPNVNAGGIVGFSTLPYIDGCTNNGYVHAYPRSDTTDGGNAAAGGIVGYDRAENYTLGGIIKNCENTAKVETDSAFVTATGGIVGSTASTVENCKNSGIVYGDTSNRSGRYEIHGYTGGIAGESTGSINSCYNTGDITNWGFASNGTTTQSAMHIKTGGIVGDLLNATATNCYNTGNIIAGNYQPASVTQIEDNVYTGGIVGAMRNTLSFTTALFNSYNTGVVDGTGYNGGGVGAVFSTSCIVSGVYSQTNTEGLRPTSTTVQRIVSRVIGGSTNSYGNYTWRLDDAEMQDKTSFAGFSFGDIWIYDTATSYPYPELVSFTDYTPTPESTLIEGAQTIGAQIPSKGEIPLGASGATVPIGAKFAVRDVTWNSEDTTFLGDTVYTADITLLANDGFTFSDNITYLVSGSSATQQKSISADRTSVTITVTFNKTSPKLVRSISVYGSFDTEYYCFEMVDFTGIRVNASFDDGTIEEIFQNDFAIDTQNLQTTPGYIGSYNTVKVYTTLPTVPDTDVEEWFNVRIVAKTATADDFAVTLPTNLVSDDTAKIATIEVLNSDLIGAITPVVYYSTSPRFDPYDWEADVPTRTPPTKAGVYYVYVTSSHDVYEIGYNSFSFEQNLVVGSFTVMTKTGDLDDNGTLELTDLDRLMDGITGEQPLEPFMSGDANGDGRVNVLDHQSLYEQILGI